LLVRLDLYLKTSRLVKRRTVAKELCEAGRVSVNGREEEPSRKVRIGDRVAVRYAVRTIEIEVLALPVRSVKTSAEDLYRVLSDVRTPDEGMEL
jgi:ribosomal 50S subunit-recycling heat shock protein